MRVLDRFAAVVVALAFVLAGLGAPCCGETLEPGAVVTAAHRSIVHDGPSVLPPDGRSGRRLQLGVSDAAPRPGAVVDAPVTTPGRPTPPSGDPRAVGARLTPPDAPSELWTEVSGGPRGDHRAGVVTSDGPDDLLPAAPLRVGGAPQPVVAPTRYGQPAVSLPPRGSLPSRAPPALA
ncbi:hypothetical protein ONA70_27405 [Micromonospora yasonensis]|uniref:hypothetical protein n=1 Tax=Micromonospora yasonensis TaxID=1128667 RepID=UPI00222E92D8|nr:hypothetical protein [Micromonospora yasonensis]MCW3843831.1 hypothetical protein [Micromonospora yasonensis]